MPYFEPICLAVHRQRGTDTRGSGSLRDDQALLVRVYEVDAQSVSDATWPMNRRDVRHGVTMGKLSAVGLVSLQRFCRDADVRGVVVVDDATVGDTGEKLGPAPSHGVYGRSAFTERFSPCRAIV